MATKTLEETLGLPSWEDAPEPQAPAELTPERRALLRRYSAPEQLVDEVKGFAQVINNDPENTDPSVHSNINKIRDKVNEIAQDLPEGKRAEFLSKIPERGGFWGRAIDLAQGLGDSITDRFPQDVARVLRGRPDNFEDETALDRFIAEQAKDQREAPISIQRLAEDTWNKSLYEGTQSLPLSTATMVLGQAAGAALTPVFAAAGAAMGAPAGPGGVVAGGAGSALAARMTGQIVATGATFYRLAVDSAADEYRQMLKSNGVKLTNEQWRQELDIIHKDLQAMGIWEAGPEAFSMALSGELWKSTFRVLPKGVRDKIQKDVIDRFATGAVSQAINFTGKLLENGAIKTGLEVAEENLTEATTSVGFGVDGFFGGQEAARRRMGLTDERSTFAEAVKDNFGPVTVGALLQSGAFYALGRPWAASPEARAEAEKQYRASQTLDGAGAPQSAKVARDNAQVILSEDAKARAAAERDALYEQSIQSLRNRLSDIENEMGPMQGRTPTDEETDILGRIAALEQSRADDLAEAALDAKAAVTPPPLPETPSNETPIQPQAEQPAAEPAPAGADLPDVAGTQTPLPAPEPAAPEAPATVDDIDLQIEELEDVRDSLVDDYVEAQESGDAAAAAELNAQLKDLDSQINALYSTKKANEQNLTPTPPAAELPQLQPETPTPGTTAGTPPAGETQTPAPAPEGGAGGPGPVAGLEDFKGRVRAKFPDAPDELFTNVRTLDEARLKVVQWMDARPEELLPATPPPAAEKRKTGRPRREAGGWFVGLDLPRKQLIESELDGLYALYDVALDEARRRGLDENEVARLLDNKINVAARNFDASKSKNLTQLVRKNLSQVYADAAKMDPLQKPLQEAYRNLRDAGLTPIIEEGRVVGAISTKVPKDVTSLEDLDAPEGTPEGTFTRDDLPSGGVDAEGRVRQGPRELFDAYVQAFEDLAAKRPAVSLNQQTASEGGGEVGDVIADEGQPTPGVDLDDGQTRAVAVQLLAKFAQVPLNQPLAPLLTNQEKILLENYSGKTIDAIDAGRRARAEQADRDAAAAQVPAPAGDNQTPVGGDAAEVPPSGGSPAAEARLKRWARPLSRLSETARGYLTPWIEAFEKAEVVASNVVTSPDDVDWDEAAEVFGSLEIAQSYLNPGRSPMQVAADLNGDIWLVVNPEVFGEYTRENAEAVLDEEVEHAAFFAAVRRIKDNTPGTDDISFAAFLTDYGTGVMRELEQAGITRQQISDAYTASGQMGPALDDYAAALEGLRMLRQRQRGQATNESFVYGPKIAALIEQLYQMFKGFVFPANSRIGTLMPIIDELRQGVRAQQAQTEAVLQGGGAAFDVSDTAVVELSAEDLAFLQESGAIEPPAPQPPIPPPARAAAPAPLDPAEAARRAGLLVKHLVGNKNLTLAQTIAWAKANPTMVPIQMVAAIPQAYENYTAGLIQGSVPSGQPEARPADQPASSRGAVSGLRQPAGSEGGRTGGSPAGVGTVGTERPVDSVAAEVGTAPDVSIPTTVSLTQAEKAGMPPGRPRPVLRNPDSVPRIVGHVMPGTYKGINPLQLDGVNLMLERWSRKKKTKDNAFLLADATGFGKTRQLLVAAVEIAKRDGRPALIVLPNRNIIEGFGRQAAAMGMDVSKLPIEFATYIDVRKSFLARGGAPRPYHGADKEYSVVVADEAHNLKDPASQQSRGLRGVNTSFHIFSTATPTDTPEGGVYFLSLITGQSLDTVAKSLGYKVSETVDPDDRRYKIYSFTQGSRQEDPGVFAARVTKALEMRMLAATRTGAYIRREYPFWGRVSVREVNLMTEAAQKAQDQIRDYWSKWPYAEPANEAVARTNLHNGVNRQGEPIDPKRYGSVAAAQRLRELRTHTQLLKSSFVSKEVIQRHAAEPKTQFVIVVEGVNMQTGYALGLVDTNAVGEPVGQMPSETAFIRTKLAEAGIPWVEILGGDGTANQEAMDAFQRGDARVVLLTAKSGGAGIDLDDQRGDRPRQTYMLTYDYSANITNQVMGRTSRASTMSPSDFQVIFDPNAESDNHSNGIRISKEAVLKSVQSVAAGSEGRPIDDGMLVNYEDMTPEQQAAWASNYVAPGSDVALPPAKAAARRTPIGEAPELFQALSRTTLATEYSILSSVLATSPLMKKTRVALEKLGRRKTPAIFDPATNEIVFDPESLEEGDVPNLYLALHEGVHALTHNVIVQWQNAPETLTIPQQAAVRELNRIYRKTKEAVLGDQLKDFERQVKTRGRDFSAEHPEWYGLYNLSEFASEALSSREFQELLASIPDVKPGTPARNNLWNAFKRAVKRALGITSDFSSVSTAIDAVIDIIQSTEQGGTPEALLETTETPNAPARKQTTDPFSGRPTRISGNGRPVLTAGPSGGFADLAGTSLARAGARRFGTETGLSVSEDATVSLWLTNPAFWEMSQQHLKPNEIQAVEELRARVPLKSHEDIAAEVGNPDYPEVVRAWDYAKQQKAVGGLPAVEVMRQTFFFQTRDLCKRYKLDQSLYANLKPGMATSELRNDLLKKIFAKGVKNGARWTYLNAGAESSAFRSGGVVYKILHNTGPGKAGKAPARVFEGEQYAVMANDGVFYTAFSPDALRAKVPAAHWPGDDAVVPTGKRLWASGSVGVSILDRLSGLVDRFQGFLATEIHGITPSGDLIVKQSYVDGRPLEREDIVNWAQRYNAKLIPDISVADFVTKAGENPVVVSNGVDAPMVVMDLRSVNGVVDDQGNAYIFDMVYVPLTAEDIKASPVLKPRKAVPPPPARAAALPPRSKVRNAANNLATRAKRFIVKDVAPVFKKEGKLPPVLFGLKEDITGARSAAEVRLEFTVKKFHAAVKKGYGKAYGKLDPQTVARLNNALNPTLARRPSAPLRGAFETPEEYDEAMKVHEAALDAWRKAKTEALQKAYAGIPMDVVEVLRDMRNQIDELSKDLLASGLIAGELAGVIRDNLGVYVTRSYRVFDDPKWAENVLTNPEMRYLVDNARQFILEELRATDPNATDAMAQGILEAWLDGWTRDGGGLGSLGKLGARDLSILMRQKDIAEPIRALMGEYQTPVVNYVRSVSKMAALLAQHRFLTNAYTVGLNRYFFKEPNATTGHVSKIAPESRPGRYSPLSGLYTTPEINSVLEEFARIDIPGWFLRTIQWWNAAAKTSKTVFSAMTQIRNLLGQPFFWLQNGHWDLTEMKRAATLAISRLRSMGTAEQQAYLEMLAKEGILESAAMSELRDVLADARIKDAELDVFVERTIMQGFRGRVLGPLAKLYAVSDQFGKIFGFENERQMLARAYPQKTEAAIRRMAADRIKNTYPTYSRVPDVVAKILRRQPFIGPFMTFAWEVFRTFGHNMNYMALDLRSGNPVLQKAGARRAAGLVATTVLTGMVAVATRALLGISKDEEDDMRLFLPSWSRNSQFLYWGRGKPGELKTINLSYLNPYSLLTDPIIAMEVAFTRRPWQQVLWNTGKELFAPLLSFQLGMGKLFNFGEQDREGRRIYNPQAPVTDQVLDIFSYFAETLEPGTLTRIRKRWLPAMGLDTKLRGVPFVGAVPTSAPGVRAPLDAVTVPMKPLNEVAAELTGSRAELFSFTQAFSFKIRDFNAEMQDADEIFRRPLSRARSRTAEELIDAYKDGEEARFRVVSRFHELVRAARRNGVPTPQVQKMLTEAGVPPTLQDQVLRGYYQSWSLYDGRSAETKKLKDSVAEALQSSSMREAAPEIRRHELSRQWLPLE